MPRPHEQDSRGAPPRRGKQNIGDNDSVLKRLHRASPAAQKEDRNVTVVPRPLEQDSRGAPPRGGKQSSANRQCADTLVTEHDTPEAVAGKSEVAKS